MTESEAQAFIEKNVRKYLRKQLVLLASFFGIVNLLGGVALWKSVEMTAAESIQKAVKEKAIEISEPLKEANSKVFDFHRQLGKLEGQMGPPGGLSEKFKSLEQLAESLSKTDEYKMAEILKAIKSAPTNSIDVVRRLDICEQGLRNLLTPRPKAGRFIGNYVAHHGHYAKIVVPLNALRKTYPVTIRNLSIIGSGSEDVKSQWDGKYDIHTSEDYFIWHLHMSGQTFQEIEVAFDWSAD